MRLGFLGRAPLIVWFAIILQAVTGGVLLFTGNEVLPTPIGDLREILTQSQIGLLLLASASAALIGTAVAKQRATVLTYWAPQQFLLIFAALSSTRAVLSGHYADGVPRPWEFIFVDQLPTILLSVAYIAAMVKWVRGNE